MQFRERSEERKDDIKRSDIPSAISQEILESVVVSGADLRSVSKSTGKNTTKEHLQIWEENTNTARSTITEISTVSTSVSSSNDTRTSRNTNDTGITTGKLETPFDFNKENEPSSVRGKPSACVFVASLCSTKSDDVLGAAVSNHFSKYGQVTNIKVLRDVRNRPYAFVQYRTDEDCHRAIANGHNSLLHGRKLRCEAAKVNRTLFIDLSTPRSQSEVRKVIKGLGETEQMLAADKHGVPLQFETFSQFWFIKFVYRDDAIRAFASLSCERYYHIEWAQNIEEKAFGKRDRPGKTPVPLMGFDKYSVFVSHLGNDVAAADLRERFSRHGSITNVQFISRQSKLNGSSFAFITYEEEVGAARAVEIENHSMLKDKNIHVQYKEIHHKHNNSHNKNPLGVQLAPPPINMLKRVKPFHTQGGPKNFNMYKEPKGDSVTRGVENSHYYYVYNNEAPRFFPSTGPNHVLNKNQNLNPDLDTDTSSSSTSSRTSESIRNNTDPALYSYYYYPY
ncbi:hypothetical protein PSN45_004197 [Yamadazyma tenuis]|uniref:RRM domain-containing protein n=1 Tax=Candida tenuis (strain ATCC 10573 / BCRC 21748 / CBS 615 / JCM 9827 / NBRC 10315 / NRRL Y-1498 / VKM Y-70) TaxID=590646 RepID=G3B3U6_CANTC|nr:uncharacterized protein CANTEDRAFT_93249 [Yamadazyma tenuis ATCC 10573]EGV63737.1 hypothetical protein CANTEDRAFT_93249 [Yamadazyma tenuis ATCC 10573]WEJ96655.1 hypothetical protein PSN45_004197 [Yamadazyma tenuis]